MVRVTPCASSGNMRTDVLGFHNLTINLTGFSGIELLHVTKAVPLFGM
jgi:hypothetical protein